LADVSSKQTVLGTETSRSGRLGICHWHPTLAGGESSVMLISIIVPAFNEERLLGASLAQIKATAGVIERRGWQWELIVCDNNSTDRTPAIAMAAGAKVAFEPINQIGRARNCGAAEATGDWLWFIDGDSMPSPALFAAVVREIDRHQSVAVGTTLQFDDVDAMYAFMAGLWKMWSLCWSHMAGSFIAVDAEAFRAIGGFSTEFYAGEELDLSRRLSRWGKQQTPRRRVKVLSGVPLRTSGRKSKLYSKSENARFVWRMLWSPFRTLKRKESCDLWYDGRR
jgi:glycosyltransferase involved in cell wall biosynthesis